MVNLCGPIRYYKVDKHKILLSIITFQLTRHVLDQALYKLLSLLPVLLDQEKFHFYELMLASKELLLYPASALDILYSRD